MMKLRWDPSMLIQGQHTSDFWKNHFTPSDKKVLFILGKGFDVRMNTSLKNLLENSPSVDLTCWMIDFDEGPDSSSSKYKKHVDENYKELKTLLSSKTLIEKKIALWSLKKRGKRQRIGDRQAAGLLSDFSQIANFTDIIVDISSLPRGVYFSLVGKFLSFIDRYAEDNAPNFFITVSENAEIDIRIKEKGIDEDIGYLYGFGGGMELASDREEPVVWCPILGEDKLEHLEKAHVQIRPHEICPVLPFPSKDPRRSDQLIQTYYQLLFERLNIEPQNLMYVPERNPFEAYIRLTKAICNYHNSLEILGGCKAVISTFSSKLLSIGTLLCAYDLLGKVGVGVLNVDSQGYEIDDYEEMKKLMERSELFVIWLTGEPYTEN
ncbi:hypothetical protein M3B46_13295 [Sphingobacterium daejeonense]|uniref:hypothetical protein n=2 Tax=Sphingobacterium daejeonense TaxID=371142 RepID=UPI0021A2C3EF|nr:hypothetical protein [Sphingobacterium daejeonense]MCT1531972.1 hypothetical protein [Sphingobacterium daejeonense]